MTSNQKFSFSRSADILSAGAFRATREGALATRRLKRVLKAGTARVSVFASLNGHADKMSALRLNRHFWLLVYFCTS